MSNELKLALLSLATALFGDLSGCDLSQIPFLGV